ncbi:MAG TPA: hypothetical protein VH859_08045 [Candidatus Limnocylindria bacterium]|jgi:hypothetical protein
MARRGGKAASRRSRQRKAAQRSAPQPQRDTRPADSGEAVAASDVGPSDAFEKADAELRASTPPPGSRPENVGGRRPTVRARTSDFVYGAGGGPSRLGERAAAEYHYVLRDLRNIGVLLVVLAVLLAVAVLAVNVLGIGPS